MATVAPGQIGTALITLTANTVETVTFTDNIGQVDVISLPSNTADLWYTIDGSTPTVGGGNCFFLPAGMVDTRETVNASGGATDLVKLISNGTPIVRVQQTARGF